VIERVVPLRWHTAAGCWIPGVLPARSWGHSLGAEAPRRTNKAPYPPIVLHST